MDIIKFIERSYRVVIIALKSIAALSSLGKLVAEDAEQTLEKKLAEEKNPTTFFGKIKKNIKNLVDFATSPSAGRIIAVSSALYLAITGGFIAVTGAFLWPVAAAIVVTAVAAAGIGIGIQAVRLRNFQQSQLEVSILDELTKELSADPSKSAKLQKLLEKPEYKKFQVDKDTNDPQVTKFSWLKSAGKQFANSLAENTASTALSILSGNWILAGINGFITFCDYGNNTKMRISLDKEYTAQQNQSKDFKSHLGMNIKTQDIAQLRELYKDITGKEFPHKVPTFGAALWQSTITNGFSSKDTIAQYSTRHNPYQIKTDHNQDQPAKEKQSELATDKTKEPEKLKQSEPQNSHSNPIKRIIKNGPKDPKSSRIDHNLTF